MAALRKNHPIAFCVLVSFLTVAVLNGVGQLTNMIMGSGLVPDPRTTNPWAYYIPRETALVLMCLAILAATGRLCLLQRRGSGILRGILIGMPMFALAVAGGIARLASELENGSPIPPAANIIVFVLAFALVGIGEELSGRSIVAETLLEHFGLSRKGIFAACGLSGLFFGLEHLANLLRSAPAGVLVQAMSAAFLGMMLAAIYLRCGNVWAPAIIHAVWDIAITITSLFGSSSVNQQIGGVSPAAVLPAAIFAAIAIFLLRKSKLEEVRRNWSDLVEESNAQ